MSNWCSVLEGSLCCAPRLRILSLHVYLSSRCFLLSPSRELPACEPCPEPVCGEEHCNPCLGNGPGTGAEADDADGFVGEGNRAGSVEATRRWQLMVRQ